MRLPVLMSILCISFAVHTRTPAAHAQTIYQVVVPEGTTVHRDIAYVPNGHERQRLDLYVPSTSRPVPLIIAVHGGGWQRGDKYNNTTSSVPWAVPILLRAGYAVTSLNYRLSQHQVFPAQIHDVKRL